MEEAANSGIEVLSDSLRVLSHQVPDQLFEHTRLVTSNLEASITATGFQSNFENGESRHASSIQYHKEQNFLDKISSVESDRRSWPEKDKCRHVKRLPLAGDLKASLEDYCTILSNYWIETMAKYSEMVEVAQRYFHPKRFLENYSETYLLEVLFKTIRFLRQKAFYNERSRFKILEIIREEKEFMKALVNDQHGSLVVDEESVIALEVYLRTTKKDKIDKDWSHFKESLDETQQKLFKDCKKKLKSMIKKKKRKDLREHHDKLQTSLVGEMIQVSIAISAIRRLALRKDSAKGRVWKYMRSTYKRLTDAKLFDDFQNGCRINLFLQKYLER